MVKKAIQYLGTLSLGVCIGALIFKDRTSDEDVKNLELKNRYKQYYNMLNQWLGLKMDNQNLSQYLMEKGYKQVAIYGMGELGNRLWEELKNTDIDVSYAIDQNPVINYSNLKIITKDTAIPDVDAIIVTVPYAYDEIKKELETKTDCPILSLEEVVYGV